MTRHTLYLETFLVSLAVILLEVSYTRVFSFKLVYYFTYLIIGISLLGLGTGGVFVTIFPRLRRHATARSVPLCCVAASAAVLLGYLLVARTQLNAFRLVGWGGGSRWDEAVKLALVCATVFAPFLAGGLALATIFSTQTARINRLYFADLLGAGLGCAACIPLMTLISPPGCVMLAGLLFALAGARLAAAGLRVLLVPGGLLALGLLLGAVFPDRLPDPVPDSVKTMAPKPDHPLHVLFSRWSPVFRLDVLRIPDPDSVFLSHDGTLGSVMERYNGDPASLARFDDEDRALPFRLLGPSPRVAIVGAAGGHEILASLHFDAGHVTGIELNPATYSLLTTHFADYSGHLGENPRVTLVNAEGRSFLKASPERYDLIWFVAPDSYAAMNAATSGAFVLSESYLYTAEMIVDSLAHLAPDGLVCTQFGEVDFERKPNRTARYLGTAREAFRRLGIEDFPRHVLVATSPGFNIFTSATILLRRTPFTEADVARFRQAVARVKNGRVLHAGTADDGGGPVNQVISLPPAELARWYDAYPFDVRPVTDDSPFFWHFVRFRDVIAGSARFGAPSPEEGYGEKLLLLLLGVATLLAALFLIAPLLAIRDVWRTIPYKGRAAAYFAALGVGFMFLEVSLIQRLTLFLGYPTYSLTVTLFALLVSTGLGSLVSDRAAARHDRMLLVLGACLLALIAFYHRGLTPVVDHAVGWPLAGRVTVAVLLLAPLGLCLGAFMPLGLRTVAALTPHGEEFVAWSWAVNGFFSVVSSVAATILSMTVGFNVVLLAAGAVYVIGIAAMLSVPAPPQQIGEMCG